MMSRHFLRAALALCLVAGPLIAGQSEPVAPPPSQIISAHSIFLSNAPWDPACHIYKGGSDQAENSFYSDLQHWNHFQIVTEPSAADLVFQLACRAPSSDASVPGHTITTYKFEVVLRIRDPKSNVVLKTLQAEIPTGFLAKNRDKEFDKALADLIQQLQTLTAGQVGPARS